LISLLMGSGQAKNVLADKAFIQSEAQICASDPTSPTCSMTFESKEVQDAVTEFAYGTKAQYAYEQMRAATTPVEKKAWKTKMITNKCARATLINARKAN